MREYGISSIHIYMIFCGLSNRLKARSRNFCYLLRTVPKLMQLLNNIQSDNKQLTNFVCVKLLMTCSRIQQVDRTLQYEPDL